MDLLEKMSTFVRIVEAGTLSSAAKQIGISTAAVSRQLSTLEAELRTSLVTRSTRRLVITDQGRQYYERCQRILRDVEEAQTIGRARVEGLLRVNASVTFGVSRVLPHLDSLMKKHPHLRIDLRLEDRLVDPVMEGVDLLIRAGATVPASTQLVAHKLLSYQRVLVASPHYLARKGTPKTPDALSKHHALTHAPGDLTDTWTLVRDGKEARVKVDVLFRSNALFALRQLALVGKGIALLPDWFVADDVKRRGLRILLPDWRTEAVNVSAVHRIEHRGAPRVRALVDHLREAYA